MMRLAWISYSPEAWNNSRYSKIGAIREEEWVKDQLSSGTKSWDLITNSIDGDAANRRDWPRPKSE
jgi:hypothetical protein